MGREKGKQKERLRGRRIDGGRVVGGRVEGGRGATERGGRERGRDSKIRLVRSAWTGARKRP